MRFIILTFFSFASAYGSRVIELSDRFLEFKKDAHWLVMFYAPWCAHCKRLEPVWLHVAQSLHLTEVKVGRVDCTRYTSVATHFNINSFPTIMFVKGDEREVIFRGDRTKEEIIKFAHRLHSPPAQQVTRIESFKLLEDSRELFFMYVGSYTTDLWGAYYNLAHKFQPVAFFYSTSSELMNKHVKVSKGFKDPAVLVFKERKYYTFEPAENKLLNESLSDWVNEERFNTFMKVTKGNMHQFYQTNKYIVVAVITENILEEVPEDMLMFRNVVESIIINERDKYHRYFQFCWMASPDLANSIAMRELELPHLLVINTTTNHHHLADFGGQHVVKPSQITGFLDSILNETAEVHGGDSWRVSSYRAWYDGTTALSEMWRGNPVLTSVLFGLPLGFLSLILYSTCCADILDAPEEEESDDYPHQKKE